MTSVGDLLAADPARRRGRDVRRDVARERDEVVVARDEVGLAVDLDDRADLRVVVDVGLDRPLGGDALAAVLDALALLDAQQLDRLLDVAVGLGQRALAVHHAGARAVAQRLDVGGRDVSHRWPPARLLGSGAAGAAASGSAAGSSGAAAAARRPRRGVGGGSAGAASARRLRAGSAPARLRRRGLAAAAAARPLRRGSARRRAPRPRAAARRLRRGSAAAGARPRRRRGLRRGRLSAGAPARPAPPGAAPRRRRRCGRRRRGAARALLGLRRRRLSRRRRRGSGGRSRCGGLGARPAAAAAASAARGLLGLAAGALLGLAARALLGLGAQALLLGAVDAGALADDLADRARDHRARADRVVVAGDHEVDPVGVAVGVDEPDDRDPQALRLAHRDRLGLEVDRRTSPSGVPFMFLTPPRLARSFARSACADEALARRQQRELALGLVALEVVQAPDPLAHRLEVRQQAAEPAVVDVRHAGRLGDLLDRVARLLLGADEQHRAAAVARSVPANSLA